MNINQKTGLVIYNKQEYHLTKGDIKLLVTLAKNKVATFEQLYEAIYNARPNVMSEHDRRLIYVAIGRLKKKIPLVIKRYYGYGYELEV